MLFSLIFFFFLKQTNKQKFPSAVSGVYILVISHDFFSNVQRQFLQNESFFFSSQSPAWERSHKARVHQHGALWLRCCRSPSTPGTPEPSCIEGTTGLLISAPSTCVSSILAVYEGILEPRHWARWLDGLFQAPSLRAACFPGWMKPGAQFPSPSLLSASLLSSEGSLRAPTRMCEPGNLASFQHHCQGQVTKSPSATVLHPGRLPEIRGAQSSAMCLGKKKKTLLVLKPPLDYQPCFLQPFPSFWRQLLMWEASESSWCDEQKPPRNRRQKN